MRNSTATGHKLASAALLRFVICMRPLDAYRSDLRRFFQWATDAGLEVLKATRPQIELYVRALDARGLAATTIDCHLSTACGYYRVAHTALQRSG